VRLLQQEDPASAPFEAGDLGPGATFGQACLWRDRPATASVLAWVAGLALPEPDASGGDSGLRVAGALAAGPAVQLLRVHRGAFERLVGPYAALLAERDPAG